MSALEEIKLIIGIVDDSEDALLQLLIERAESIVEQLSRSPKDNEHIVIEAVIIAYNQRGAEGTKSTSVIGMGNSWAYSTMYDFIKSKLPARYVIK